MLSLYLLAGPGICGTPWAIDMWLKGQKLPRPTNQTYIISPNGHFLIHFDTTGDNAVSREYAESIAVYAEHAWDVYINQMGWYEPPSDGGLGGDSRYDMYVQTLSGGVLGYTSPEGYAGDYQGGYSYIVIGRNQNWMLLRNTVVHEFQHACQMGYEFPAGRTYNVWYMENTAVWGQEMCYPDDDEYMGYLSGVGPIKRPNYEIIHMTNPTDLYEYAGVVWNFFLMTWTGDTDVVRKVWERKGVDPGYYTLSVIDDILYAYYNFKHLVDALRDYAVARYFVGSRYRDFHGFWPPDAARWPDIQITKNHSSYPAQGNEGIFDIHGPGGCGYVRFYNFPNDDTMRITFDGADGYDWDAFVLGIKDDQQFDLYEIELDNQTATGEIKVALADYDTLVLVPVIVSWRDGYPTDGLEYSYTANLVLTDVSEGPSLPLRTEVRPVPGGLRYSVPSGKVARITLYDPTGRVVRSAEVKDQGVLRLNLKGVYFWRAEDGRVHLKGKIVL